MKYCLCIIIIIFNIHFRTNRLYFLKSEILAGSVKPRPMCCLVIRCLSFRKAFSTTIRISSIMYESLGTNDSDWAGKTANEIREIGQQNGSILVIPVGSVEQHGGHLPVATDTILVDAFTRAGSERVVEDLPILVMPTMWQGFSPHHLPFGGTISLEFGTMLKAIEQIAETGIENGFDVVLLINGHGGNISLINSAVKTIGRRTPDVAVHGITYFHLARQFIDEIRESAEGGMSHGGEFETSLMLYLRPDLVRGDDMNATPKRAIFEFESSDLMTGGTLGSYRTFDEYSDSGAIGDPHIATEDKGEQIFERLIDEFVQLLSDMHHEYR